MLDFELALRCPQLHCLFEPFLIEDVDAELAIVVAQGDQRKLRVEGVFKAEDLFGCLREIGNVRHCNLARDLLLQRKASLGRVSNTLNKWVNLDIGDAEEL